MEIAISITIKCFWKNVNINQLKNKNKKYFDSIIMFEIQSDKSGKRRILWCKKKKKKSYVDDIVSEK